MTGMEHAIEQAAKVIEDTYLSGGDMWGDDLARALAEAGLLTPAPLIEETETDQIMEWGGPVAVIERRRRWVTDWFPVDRGEGDGSTDQ